MSENIRIEAFQSAGLLSHTRCLSRLTSMTTDTKEITCLATATILMAAATLEALTLEAAYLIKPDLYRSEEFRKRTGIKKKFKEVTGDDLDVLCPDALELWENRLALTHAEPIHPRTRFVGEKLNVAGAHWAVETIEKAAKVIWGKKMPTWFSEETGLYP